jgi:5'-nucleotidase
MRALVTNDDGIHAVGIRTLAEAAVAAGLEVVVAAPSEEYSGSSASLTALQTNGRLTVHEAPVDIAGPVRCVGVDATPAFIAIAASSGAFGPPPDLVLSGVNHGPNTGYAVLHSGTVGAALTAATHGRPAVAFSLAAARPTQFQTARSVAARVLDWVLTTPHPSDLVLNVNIPDRPWGDVHGFRSAALAAFGAVQAKVADEGLGFVTMTFEEVDAAYEAGTDAALVRDGWVTLTALAAPCRAPDVDLDGLAENATSR